MKFKKANVATAEIDMTPMIDIVFQLIAFFMVITNFEQTQADERVILAKDALAMPPKVKREDELTVNIGFERNLEGEKIDPQAYIFWPGEKMLIEGLEAKLRLEAQIYRDEGKDIKEITVVIRADAEVPTGIVQGVIKIAQKDGIKFEKFAIKAQQSVDP
ncbi:MAG: biopolymer transporter ExbD [Planctomycetaceae bacterium]|jgi:biopolymer transport protein ExbD|nr:biopolymer transporter ExbD [Planctomycetaceae bacterium]